MTKTLLANTDLVDVKRVDSATGSELSCRMVKFYQIVKITRLLSIVTTLKVSNATMYSIREANGSQWSRARTCVICSVRFVQVTIRARGFWTLCNFWMFDVDVRYKI